MTKPSLVKMGKPEHDKSIFTNDISLILDRGPMIGYIWSHAPPWYSSNSCLGAHAPMHLNKNRHTLSCKNGCSPFVLD